MERQPLWKILAVLAAFVLSILAIYPPEKRLRPGLDLAGGTTLVYQVNLPPDTKDAGREINDTISVLQNRVDPTGVRSLVWRQQAGNRIEIQMPQASAVSTLRRDAYLQARKQLFAGNTSARQLESMLKLPADQRNARLSALATENPDRQETVGELIKAADALDAAAARYAGPEADKKKAEAALKAAADSASEADKKKLQEKFDAALKLATQRAREVNAARNRYKAAVEAVTRTNIETAEFDRILALPNTPPAGKPEGTPSARAEAAEALAAGHKGRADQVRAAIKAYNEYEMVKGSLDDPNDLMQLLRGSGVLEFRIAATPGELADEAVYRDQLATRGPRVGAEKTWRWHLIDNAEGFFENSEARNILFPADNVRDDAWAQKVSMIFTSRGLVGQVWANDFYVLLGNSPDNSLTTAQKDWRLESAYQTMDPMSGGAAVAFGLNPVGGEYMGNLTGSHLKKPMAIVLDGRVISAPTVQSRISGHGQITGGGGGFSPRELEYLVRTLKAGSLKARLSESPIAIQKTGAQFGEDNLVSTRNATIVATAIVVLFMACYYFFLGWVANVAMVLNILLTLAAMAVLKASFTLSGIAGIVLSIGMAVDANVLIYERIREELDRKASLRTAVRLGYEKALSTILDAHVTTLITCVILYYTATADIKGFALTLGLGLVANLATAVFAARIMTDTFIDYRNPPTLRMLPTVYPAIHKFFTPNIDWVGKRAWYIGISGVLTIAGIIGMVSRGEDLFDIEFRGGTQISFELANGPDGKPKTMSLREVRDRLEEASKAPGLAKLAEASAVTVGDARGGVASAFTIQTLVTDANAVGAAIKTHFKDVLDAQQPIAFTAIGEGNEAPPLDQAPVFALRDPTLGVNINRPAVMSSVNDYLGGVAVVLDDMKPAATLADVHRRIERTRLSPEFEKLGYRNFTVIGIETEPGQTAGGASADTTLYRSVAVVTFDEQINYAENPERFGEPEGLAATEWSLVRSALRRDTALGSVSNFSSQVSDTMKQQAIVAIVLSWLAIMAYIWVRFGSIAYGVAAIAALIHDVITAVGAAALSYYVYDTFIGHALLLHPFRIDLAMIAAVLTLIGYSVNDTIVVFDRIRENRGRLAFATPQIINDSINQTISRTILTVVTVLVSVLALYVLGGPGVHGFSFVMLVGAIIGCYSSIAVAAPLLLIGHMGAKPTTAEAAGLVTAPKPK